MPTKVQVYQEVPGIDQRLGELQSQLDRLTVSLQLWRDQQEHLKPAEDRLADLTRQVTSILNQWSSTGERQARAVGQLEERVSAFGAVEERLHQDAAERLRALERVIEQEWTALREIHEAPVRELREQADTLSRVSIAATNSSVSGFDRAEARLVAIETALNDRLTTVSEQLATAVAEIRALAQARVADAPAPAWPIEGVVRLHNQLRDTNDSVTTIDTAVSAPSPSHGSIVHVPLALPAAPADVVARLESMEQALEQTFAEHDAAVRTAASEGARTTRLITLLGGGTTVLLLVAGLGGWTLQRQAREVAERVSAAERQAQAAVTAANQQLSIVRDDAAKQLADARAGTARAQMVSDVMAAPDLVRFNIAGSGPSPMSGQVLWSRTHGVVFSGVRLAPPAAGMTYQLWMLTDSTPVTAGTFVPDATGRVTFTAEAPRVPRAVIGAALTLEPAGGSATPSDLLMRNRVAAPPPPAP